jgi:hypothetical protein
MEGLQPSRETSQGILSHLKSIEIASVSVRLSQPCRAQDASKAACSFLMALRSLPPTVEVITGNPVSSVPERGALISYTYAFDAMIRQAVAYIGRILKRARPADLPVHRSTVATGHYQ